MRRIFFDTNLFIYLFEGREPYRSRVVEIRRRMLERGDRLVTSAMTLGEILVKPMELGRSALAEEYARALRASAVIVCFDELAARRYARLRAAHGLRNADAIQLACAAQCGVDLFLTNDARLLKLDVPGIGFIAAPERAPL